MIGVIRQLAFLVVLSDAKLGLAQDDGGGSGPDSEDSGPPSVSDTIIHAHGYVMAVAFAVMFPLGAIFMRLLDFRGTVWLHAGWQATAWLLAAAGLGIGAYIATTQEEWTSSNGHPIIGVIVVGCLLLQPVLGITHHLMFRRTKSPTNWGLGHRWWGRVLMILGIINGGLGLQLTQEATPGIIAYSVVAGVICVVWFAAVFFASIRVHRNKSDGTNGHKTSETSKREMTA